MIKVQISQTFHSVQADSISIEDRIEERSVATFIALDDGGQFEFKKGQPVTIGEILDLQASPFSAFNFMPFNFGTFGGGVEQGFKTIFFRGVIENSEKILITRDGAKHIINCVDYHYLADKRLAARSYENQTPGFIVADLIEQYLEAEGVTAGTIEAGVALKEVVFNYIPVAEALDKLSDRTGFWWLIDENKQLNFRSRSSFVSPLPLTEANTIKQQTKLTNDNTRYRNQQVIKGAKDLTSPQTEEFRGDGVQTTFTVGFNIAKVPTVEISDDGITWIPQTVGIRGLETGRDWYWSGGDPKITQETSVLPLTSSQFLRVIYQGEFSLVVITRDLAQIAQQQALEETGTGVVEAVQTDSTQTTREATFELAGQLLAKYGTIGRRLKTVTQTAGYKPGQLVTVDFVGYGVNTQMLIESVTFFTQGKNYFWDILAIEGPESRSWTDLFSEMYKEAQQRDRAGIGVGEVVIIPYQFEKDWLETEQPNIFFEVYPLGQPASNTLFPSFAPQDRVKYLEWYNIGGALQRKAITQQAGTTELSSITILAPNDAAGVEITKFAWIGGIDATIALGTGVKVDEQDETINNMLAPWLKTSLETWQVEKIDRKWA